MKYNLLTIFLLSLTFSYAQISQSDFERIVMSYKDSVTNPKYGINCLYQNGKGEVFYQGIGYADEDTLVNRQNIFSIGSLSKTFTAVMILQDVEDGKISLNDSLVKRFPENYVDYPKELPKSITVKELLSHTSGISPSYKDTLDTNEYLNPYHLTNYEFGFNRIPYNEQLKGKHSYSNTNYMLLGYILETVNRKPFYHLLQKRIFDKLGMENAYGFYSPNLPNVAQGFYNNKELSPYIFNRYYDKIIASGGLSMNIDDLNKFLNALYLSEELLTEDTKRIMFNFDDSYYGLGIMRTTYILRNQEQRIFVGHNGSTFTSQTLVYYDPKTKESFILLSNTYNDKIIDKIFSDLINLDVNKKLTAYN